MIYLSKKIHLKMVVYQEFIHQIFLLAKIFDYFKTLSTITFNFMEGHNFLAKTLELNDLQPYKYNLRIK